MSVSGQDLLSDAVPDDHTVIEKLAPSQTEQSRKEQLEAFARMFTFRFFEGKETEEDWRKLADCLRRDPASEPLLGFFLSAIRKAPRKSALFAAEQLRTLASEFPDSVPLNLSAGKLLIGQQKPGDAMPYLKRPFDKLLHDPASVPQPKLRRIILSRYLLTLVHEHQDEELDRAVGLLESGTYLDEIPSATEYLFIIQAVRLEREPAEPLTFFGPLRSATLVGRKKLDDCIRRYFDAWEKLPDPPLSERLGAAVLVRAGYGDRLADSLLMKYLESGENELLLILADVSELMGREVTTARFLERYLASFPKPPPGVVNRIAELLHTNGKDARAAEFLKRYEGKLPPHPPLLLNQIGIYSALRDWPRAMKAASALPGAFDRAYFQSVILQSQGRIKDAYAAARRAHEAAVKGKMKFRDHAFFLHFCNLAEKCGDVNAVDAVLSERIKISPDDPELLNFLGYTLADHGKDLPRAEKLIEKALKHKPNSAAILDSMAWVLFRLKRFDEAKKFILKAIERSGKNQDAVIMDHAGDIFSACGDAAAAKAYWEKALELPAGDADMEKIRKKLGQKP